MRRVGHDNHDHGIWTRAYGLSPIPDVEAVADGVSGLATDGSGVIGSDVAREFIELRAILGQIGTPSFWSPMMTRRTERGRIHEPMNAPQVEARGSVSAARGA